MKPTADPVYDVKPTLCFWAVSKLYKDCALKNKQTNKNKEEIGPLRNCVYISMDSKLLSCPLWCWTHLEMATRVPRANTYKLHTNISLKQKNNAILHTHSLRPFFDEHFS